MPECEALFNLGLEPGAVEKVAYIICIRALISPRFKWSFQIYGIPRRWVTTASIGPRWSSMMDHDIDRPGIYDKMERWFPATFHMASSGL